MKPTGQRVLGSWDSRAPIRRRRHGLSPDEVDGLIALQGGVCAICRKPGGPLQLDHDHRHHPGPTGCRDCVRGAVCDNCNKVLAHALDDPAILVAAAAYLRRTA